MEITQTIEPDVSQAANHTKLSLKENAPALIRQAKDRTELAVQAFYSTVGWRIAVHWAD